MLMRGEIMLCVCVCVNVHGWVWAFVWVRQCVCLAYSIYYVCMHEPWNM